ncbi:hypothetical protein [Comamonas thiooxydans]|uniref:hypothetical protein n=1 Tax=Comamonas thiooxydans TaxID=363952 RepID=UPI00211474A3|nr:hypothetical protein [Comamonas thiooxydans]UUE95137.1 hypothetical protein MJ608_05685 [Comamonas thiooxydans]
MLIRRIHRLTTSVLVVLSLLFAQLALAGYVCPQEDSVEAMTARMEAGMPCEGMDQQQPVLCHQHTNAPDVTFETVKLPVASLPAVVQVLELPLALEVDAALAVSWPIALEVRSPPDPLFLSTLRLRV